MAKSNYIVRGGGDFSALYKEFNKAQKQLTGFKKSFSSKMRSIGAVIGTLATGHLVKESTQMAMGVESSMDNINSNMQRSAGAFQKWVETQSQGYGIAQADAYKYGSTFSNLLAVFTDGAEDNAEQTQKLLEASSIIASKTGRSFDDTANRIRSGMLGSTEAIEDLGVYTNISMIESTNAFREFAGDQSWAQLDFQTQQQIRLNAILEQTYQRYGDTLADTTQTRHAQLVASLSNVKLALGQAFLPIYNAVLPALTAMANAVGRVVNLIAQFTTALFGGGGGMKQTAQAVGGQTQAIQGLGDSMKDTGKEAKKTAKALKSLAGFDEINSLSKANSDIAGGSGGSGATGATGGGIDGGMSVPPLDSGGFAESTIKVSESIQQMVDKIKAAMNDLKQFLEENKTTILSTIAGLTAGIGSYFLLTNWDKIASSIKIAMGVIKAAISAISWPVVAVATVIGLFVAALVNLWQTNEEFRTKVTNAWKGVVDTLKKYWNTIIKPVFDEIVVVAKDVWNKGLKPLWTQWENFVAEIVYLMIDLWNGIKPILDWMIKTFGPGIAEVFKYLVRTIGSAITTVIQIVGSILDAFTGIIRGVRQIFGGLIDFVAGVFTGDWRRAWSGVQQIFKGLGTVVSSVWNGIKGTFNSILSFIGGTFKSGWNTLTSIFANPIEKAKTTIKNAVDAITGFFRNIRIPEIRIPRIKLPHFRVSGSFGLSPLSVPRFNVNWYDKGGIFNSPSIIGVGEKRPEFVGALDDLRAIVREEAGPMALGGGGSDQPIDLTVNLGSVQVFKEIINGINKTQRNAGQTLIEI